jgi:hypothetical protein
LESGYGAAGEVPCRSVNVASRGTPASLLRALCPPPMIHYFYNNKSLQVKHRARSVVRCTLALDANRLHYFTSTTPRLISSQTRSALLFYFKPRSLLNSKPSVRFTHEIIICQRPSTFHYYFTSANEASIFHRR